MSHTDDMALYTKEYIMSNQAPKSRVFERTAHLFNCDHSVGNPTTASEFERRLSHWIETNNAGTKAICELKRGAVDRVYVVEVALEGERMSLAWSENGRTEISFVIINGHPITSEYEEFVTKLGGVDLSRLDDIDF
jgi:hypothetical protein